MGDRLEAAALAAVPSLPGVPSDAPRALALTGCCGLSNSFVGAWWAVLCKKRPGGENAGLVAVSACAAGDSRLRAGPVGCVASVGVPVGDRAGKAALLATEAVPSGVVAREAAPDNMDWPLEPE